VSECASKVEKQSPRVPPPTIPQALSNTQAAIASLEKDIESTKTPEEAQKNDTVLKECDREIVELEALVEEWMNEKGPMQKKGNATPFPKAQNSDGAVRPRAKSAQGSVKQKMPAQKANLKTFWKRVEACELRVEEENPRTPPAAIPQAIGSSKGAISALERAIEEVATLGDAQRNDQAFGECDRMISDLERLVEEWANQETGGILDTTVTEVREKAKKRLESLTPQSSQLRFQFDLLKGFGAKDGFDPTEALSELDRALEAMRKMLESGASKQAIDEAQNQIEEKFKAAKSEIDRLKGFSHKRLEDLRRRVASCDDQVKQYPKPAPMEIRNASGKATSAVVACERALNDPRNDSNEELTINSIDRCSVMVKEYEDLVERWIEKEEEEMDSLKLAMEMERKNAWQQLEAVTPHADRLLSQLSLVHSLDSPHGPGPSRALENLDGALESLRRLVDSETPSKKGLHKARNDIELRLQEAENELERIKEISHERLDELRERVQNCDEQVREHPCPAPKEITAASRRAINAIVACEHTLDDPRNDDNPERAEHSIAQCSDLVAQYEQVVAHWVLQQQDLNIEIEEEKRKVQRRLDSTDRAVKLMGFELRQIAMQNEGFDPTEQLKELELALQRARDLVQSKSALPEDIANAQAELEERWRGAERQLAMAKKELAYRSPQITGRKPLSASLASRNPRKPESPIGTFTRSHSLGERRSGREPKVIRPRRRSFVIDKEFASDIVSQLEANPSGSSPLKYNLDEMPLKFTPQRSNDQVPLEFRQHVKRSSFSGSDKGNWITPQRPLSKSMGDQHMEVELPWDRDAEYDVEMTYSADSVHVNELPSKPISGQRIWKPENEKLGQQKPMSVSLLPRKFEFNVTRKQVNVYLRIRLVDVKRRATACMDTIEKEGKWPEEIHAAADRTHALVSEVEESMSEPIEKTDDQLSADLDECDAAVTQLETLLNIFGNHQCADESESSNPVELQSVTRRHAELEQRLGAVDNQLKEARLSPELHKKVHDRLEVGCKGLSTAAKIIAKDPNLPEETLVLSADRALDHCEELVFEAEEEMRRAFKANVPERDMLESKNAKPKSSIYVDGADLLGLGEVDSQRAVAGDQSEEPSPLLEEKLANGPSTEDPEAQHPQVETEMNLHKRSGSLNSRHDSQGSQAETQVLGFMASQPENTNSASPGVREQATSQTSSQPLPPTPTKTAKKKVAMSAELKEALAAAMKAHRSAAQQGRGLHRTRRPGEDARMGAALRTLQDSMDALLKEIHIPTSPKHVYAAIKEMNKSLEAAVSIRSEEDRTRLAMQEVVAKGRRRLVALAKRHNELFEVRDSLGPGGDPKMDRALGSTADALDRLSRVLKAKPVGRDKVASAISQVENALSRAEEVIAANQKDVSRMRIDLNQQRRELVKSFTKYSKLRLSLLPKDVGAEEAGYSGLAGSGSRKGVSRQGVEPAQGPRSLPGPTRSPVVLPPHAKGPLFGALPADLASAELSEIAMTSMKKVIKESSESEPPTIPEEDDPIGEIQVTSLDVAEGIAEASMKEAHRIMSNRRNWQVAYLTNTLKIESKPISGPWAPGGCHIFRGTSLINCPASKIYDHLCSPEGYQPTLKCNFENPIEQFQCPNTEVLQVDEAFIRMPWPLEDRHLLALVAMNKRTKTITCSSVLHNARPGGSEFSEGQELQPDHQIRSPYKLFIKVDEVDELRSKVTVTQYLDLLGHLPAEMSNGVCLRGTIGLFERINSLDPSKICSLTAPPRSSKAYGSKSSSKIFEQSSRKIMYDQSMHQRSHLFGNGIHTTEERLRYAFAQNSSSSGSSIAGQHPLQCRHGHYDITEPEHSWN